jgi:transcriptional regulator with XRE-family HTH domain
VLLFRRDPDLDIASQRGARQIRLRLAQDVDRLCSDAGVSHAALARAAGVSQSFLSRVFAGTTQPSVATYARLAAALGADFSARFYPNTGPAIRDRHQARILEALLESIHPRWHRFTEVAVSRPARRWIDVVLHEDRERVLIASEIESTLNRVEQLVRWSTEKAEALPSWTGWSRLPETPDVSRLLVLRATRLTRTRAREAARQLRVAYPAHPADALAALTGTQPWPGPALIWAREVGDTYRLVGER